jgi:putative flippase GtrA
MRLLRYSAVSAVSTTTSLVTLGVLVGGFRLAAGWSNVVATAVGTVPSFELNRRWVWTSTARRSMARQVVPFCALSFLGLVISTIAVSLAARIGAHGDRLDHTVAVESANVAAYGTLWIVQYQLLGRFLFRSAPAGELSADEHARDEPGDEDRSGRALVSAGSGPPAP